MNRMQVLWVPMCPPSPWLLLLPPAKEEVGDDARRCGTCALLLLSAVARPQGLLLLRSPAMTSPMAEARREALKSALLCGLSTASAIQGTLPSGNVSETSCLSLVVTATPLPLMSMATPSCWSVFRAALAVA
jgi:hypothetical protein